MTNNQSSISFKKEDGKPITFNFQLENDLPYKPIIRPKFKILSNDINNLQFCIYLRSSFINSNKILNPENISFDIESNLWIHLKESYIVLMKIPDKIIRDIKDNNFELSFFDTTNNLIRNFSFYEN
jgi:hypothetical protein